jgi:hypothetical protein
MQGLDVCRRQFVNLNEPNSPLIHTFSSACTPWQHETSWAGECCCMVGLSALIVQKFQLIHIMRPRAKTMLRNLCAVGLVLRRPSNMVTITFLIRPPHSPDFSRSTRDGLEYETSLSPHKNAHLQCRRQGHRLMGRRASR